MALNIPPGYAQCSLPMQHELLGRTAYVTWGIDTSAAAGDFVAAADNCVWAFAGGWNGELDSQVVVGPAELRVGQDGGDPLTIVGTLTASGTETAAMPPPSVSLLVKKQTNLGGKQGRGRMYIPWVTQEAGINDVGNLDGSTLSVRQADALEFFEQLASGFEDYPPTPMVLLHDEPLVGSAPAPTPVVGLVVDQLVANQRRRLGR